MPIDQVHTAADARRDQLVDRRVLAAGRRPLLSLLPLWLARKVGDRGRR